MSDQSEAPIQSPGQETPDNGQPKYITQEELTRLLQDTENKAFQRAQSLYDKGQGRVQAELKRVNDSIEQMRKHGVDVPPEKVKAMQDEAVRTALIEAPPEEPKIAPQSKTSADAAPDPVTAEAWRMMKEAGVVLDESDPEMGKLDQEHGPYKFLQSVEAAIADKQRRLLSQTKSPEARLPGITGGSPGASVEAITNQLAELQRNPTANIQKIRELSAQLKKALPTSQ